MPERGFLIGVPTFPKLDQACKHRHGLGALKRPGTVVNLDAVLCALVNGSTPSEPSEACWDAFFGLPFASSATNEPSSRPEYS